MINPYAYTPSVDGVECKIKKETSLGIHYTVNFRSAFPARYLGENAVVGEYLLPRGQKRAPLAILLHGMGDRSVWPCRLIARTLARKGIASFILYLVSLGA